VIVAAMAADFKEILGAKRFRRERNGDGREGFCFQEIISARESSGQL
jgi:hypothetical protein